MSSLNFRYEMIMCPASISKITDFTINIFIYEWSFIINTLFLSKFFLFRIIIFSILLSWFFFNFSIFQLFNFSLQLPSKNNIFLNFSLEISLLLENIWTFLQMFWNWFLISTNWIQIDILEIWERMTPWSLENQIFFTFIHFNQLAHDVFSSLIHLP